MLNLTEKWSDVGLGPMSVEGQSRPKWAVHAMSGLPPLATELRTSREVRKVPKAEVTSLFTSSPQLTIWPSFGQPGLPQPFSVSRKIFGTPKRAQQVFEIGNT